MSREYDICIFGATGYTGEHVARSVQRMARDGTWAGVKWAIAGRSRAKLDALIAKNGLEPTGVVIADTSTPITADGAGGYFGLSPLAAMYRLAPGIFHTAERDVSGKPYFTIIDECRRAAEALL